jgi:hypothetical protein
MLILNQQYNHESIKLNLVLNLTRSLKLKMVKCLGQPNDMRDVADIMKTISSKIKQLANKACFVVLIISIVKQQYLISKYKFFILLYIETKKIHCLIDIKVASLLLPGEYARVAIAILLIFR